MNEGSVDIPILQIPVKSGIDNNPPKNAPEKITKGLQLKREISTTKPGNEPTGGAPEDIHNTEITKILLPDIDVESLIALNPVRLVEEIRKLGLSPEQRKELFNILKKVRDEGVSISEAKALLSGMPMEVGTQYPSDEIDMDTKQCMVAIAEMEGQIQDPNSAEKGQVTTFLRLREFFQRSLPSMTDIPLRMGRDGFVTVQLDGIKRINQLASMSLTADLLERIKDETLRTFWEINMVPLEALASPAHELYKGITIKIDDLHSITDINKRISTIEQQVRYIVKQIVEREIPSSSRAILDNFEVTAGYAIANNSDREDSFNTWQRATTNAQVKRVQKLKARLQTSPIEANALPESLQALLEQAPSSEPETATVDLFRLAEEIRQFATQRFFDMGLSDFVESDKSGNRIFSMTFLEAVRKKDVSILLGKLAADDPRKKEIEQIYNLGLLYGETIVSTMVIKDYTFDEQDKISDRNANFRARMKRIINHDEEIVEDTFELAHKDHRFARTDRRNLILSLPFFDYRVAKMPHAHYVTIDLKNIGAQIYQDAQRRQVDIASTIETMGDSNAYLTILEKTRDLGEAQWKNIFQSFHGCLDHLLVDPQVGGLLENPMKQIAAYARGDEMTIAVSADVGIENLTRSLSMLQTKISQGEFESEARLTIAEATREDTDDQNEGPRYIPQDRLVSHLNTLKLCENSGMDLARIADKMFPDRLFFVQVRNSKKGPKGKIHFISKNGSIEESTEWVTIDETIEEQLIRTGRIQSKAA